MYLCKCISSNAVTLYVRSHFSVHRNVALITVYVFKIYIAQYQNSFIVVSFIVTLN